MAKKTEKEDKNDYLAKIQKEIDSEFGEGVLSSSRLILENPRQVIKFSPALDGALGGGIPEGCLVTCSGPPKGGKTTSTLHFCSKFQQPEYGNRHVYYLDAEARLKPMNLSCIPGLDLDRFHHIHSIEGNILTAEKFLTIAEKILYTHPGSLVVIDSISCLCPEAEMTGDLTAQFRASGPRLFSLFCKRVANILPVNRVTLWGIQHTHSSMGPGAGKSEDGGLKIQYALDVKMRMTWAEDWTVGTNENQRVVGKIAHWNIITSALGSSPNQKVDSYIRFGVGIDEIKENIETGVSLDIIKKGGAWYTFNEEKFQGEEKLYQAFTTNPEMVKLLEEKIKELTG